MTQITTGIVFKKSDYGDYDGCYTIYTRDFGKINAIAKGTKKVTSKLCGNLEPYSAVELMLAQGARLKRIAAVKTINNYSSIKKDLVKIVIASYFIESVDNLTVWEAEDGRNFDLLLQFLTALDQDIDYRNAFLLLNKNIFELLKYLGYEPEIGAKSQQLLLNAFNRLIVETAEKEMKSFTLLDKVLAQA
ncbi:MAG: DNA repair protein RecO [Patescibacteria group bacterium]